MFELGRLLNRKRLLYEFESPLMPRPAYSAEENTTIREDFLDGAIKLFRQVGAEELSLRRLAKHLDISHTKLYRYFGSKEELLIAIRQKILEELQVEMYAQDPTDASATARLRAASYAFCKFAVSNEKEYFFLFSDEIENTRNSKAYLKQRQALFNFIVEIAKQAQVKGQTDLDGRTLANLAWATMHGLFLLHFRGQFVEGRSFEDLFESAMSLLFGPAKDEACGSSGSR
ncbi:TetR/AcrR family transcriptional regulator [Henriciella barbarensis]|uniref:TetR/AcrR family transcriptional regulator n=2 Tax=Henriciella TaxID=453849 RepID=UPI0015FBBA88|nr:TetR/AcrR family transcriptional regulator [Henriciella barbarensis]